LVSSCGSCRRRRLFRCSCGNVTRCPSMQAIHRPWCGAGCWAGSVSALPHSSAQPLGCWRQLVVSTWFWPAMGCRWCERATSCLSLTNVSGKSLHPGRHCSPGMSSSLRDVLVAPGCPRRSGMSSSLRGNRHRLRLHELCELGSPLVLTALGEQAPVVAVLHRSSLIPGTSLYGHSELALGPVHPGGTFSLLRLYGPRKLGPGWRPKGASPPGVTRGIFPSVMARLP